MSYSHYEYYFDSGINWLGKVPAHWNKRRLKFCAPAQNTKTNRKSEDLPYIGLEHIESGTGVILGTADTSEVDSIVSLFENGDLLFSKLRPYLAKVVVPGFAGSCTSELGHS